MLFDNQAISTGISEKSSRYPALTQTKSRLKQPKLYPKNGYDQQFSDLDQFSPLSDFENAIQDSLSEVSELLRDLDVTQKEDDELSSKSNYRYYMDYARFSPHWKNAEWRGWRLPAQGNHDKYCQKWNFFGCNNVKYHPDKKHYCEHQLFQCKRSRCPKCVESWINRQSNRTTRRIKKHMKIHKSIFKSIVLSPPPEKAANMDYNSLKKWLTKTLKIANIETACIVFHPFRFRDKKKLIPYVSPHFHIATPDHITNTREFYNKTKWIIKNKGDLETDVDVFNFSRYIFSHAGTKERTHVIRYIGSISYRKLKIEKEPKTHLCPYCDLPLLLFRLNPTMKCKPPPINHIGLYDKDAFTLVDIINNDSKIPFYDLVDEPKSTIDYQEHNIYSFELQLLQKIRLPQVMKIQQNMNNVDRKTSLQCTTLNDWI